jgi:hypothetical protein
VHFHYHHEPHGPWWDRIKPRLTLRHIELEQFIERYPYDDARIAAFRYAHLADFARLRILLAEGGIYADMDTLFLRPFPRHWRQRPFILGREKAPPPAQGSLCNAWIASAPRAAFCRLWLTEMTSAFDGSWSNHSTLLPFRLANRHPELLAVEPETAFYALDWTSAGIANLFLRHVPLPDCAYSLHLWSHLWFDPARRDFSRFHGGLLTPDYVAYANTTYARHARPFLPADTPVSRARYLVRTAAALPDALRAWRVGRSWGRHEHAT